MTVDAPKNVEVILMDQQPTQTHKREVFEVLNSVRVFLTLWVVSFHSLWHLAMFLDEGSFFQLYHKETNGFLAGGLNAVDYFFVMTGFLVAYPIFKGSRTVTWFEFVWLRVTRIYPMLIASIILFCVFISNFGQEPYLTWAEHPTQALKAMIDNITGVESLGMPNNCHISWINLLFINNLVPFGGCMGWTWSLCIQVHFFLIFPLIIKWFGRGKNLLGFFAVATCLWVILRSWLYFYILLEYLPKGGITSMYIYTEDQIPTFFVMFNIWYSSTPQRINCCFGGCLLAYLQVNKPRWLISLDKSKFASTLMTILSFASLWASFHVNFANPYQVILFSVGGPIHILAISTLFYLLINNIGPLSIFVPILKSKIFEHLAYPSYGVYLAHSFIIVWLYKQPWMKPLTPVTNSRYGYYVCIVLILSYTYGYLATRFIEEPIKNFLRKYVDPTPQPHSPNANSIVNKKQSEFIGDKTKTD